MRNVLLVDDEKRMLDLLALYLKPHGYASLKAKSGKEAIELLEDELVDLVILDIMMPEMNGWEVCRQIRRFSNVPIIMLTAREQQEDIVKGLRLGADDYLVKPFGEEELLARMEALLRRSAPVKMVKIDGLVWDEERFELAYHDSIIRLTPKEFAMLGLLMKNPDKVYERSRLLELIWGFDSETEGRTVDSHVRNIREKIRQSGFPIDEYFLTVWGIGYKWVNPK